MGAHIPLLILSCLLYCTAEFTDYMQVYEKECLGEDKMTCADGSCVWKHQYCDGKVDCLDGSDENLCVDHTPDPVLCTNNTHFLCRDQSKCIPESWLCNNQTDCADGSDEINCTAISLPEANATCKGFTCVNDKRCISQMWVCDGSYDCADRSDENQEACRHWRPSSLRTSCPDHIVSFLPGFRYLCLDGSLCLEMKNMCDGLQDCKDGSDEGAFCTHWHEQCTNKTCLGGSTCRPDRSGAPLCDCADNYNYYNESAQNCVPYNVCAEARPSCSQRCLDTGGSHHCSCDDGYNMDKFSIGHLCFAPDPEGMLFFSTRNEIKYITLKSKKVVTVATGVRNAHGVACDGTFVYWVETAQGHQAIVRAPLDNIADTKTVLVGLGLEDPGDIAIDWVGGNFYFSDAERGTISACSIQGQVCTTIDTEAHVPKHIALDVKRGMMYWADWRDKKPVIMRAGMDGAAPSQLLSLHSPAAALCVDPPAGLLYYIEGTLKGARLDSGLTYTVNTRLPTFHTPYALSVFENNIYWSDWASNTIQSWAKVDGDSYGPLAKLDSPAYGLSVYHPIIHRGLERSTGACSHLRLVTSGGGARCACPAGLELHSNTTCRPMSTYRPEYLVAGAGSALTLIQHNALGGQAGAPVAFDVGHVQALAYDTLRDTLYIYDAKWKAISSVKMSDFHRGSATMTWFMGFDNVVDMDYDYMTDNLYIVDAGRKFVEAISLRTSKRAVLHRFDQEVPISLCVMPEYGKMLIAVSESEQNYNIHIDSFGLDGSSRQHRLTTNLRGPHVRLRYSRKMDAVYLADEGNSVIDYMHPEGTGRETFRELSTSVTELAVTDTLVLWSTRRSHRLYWADIHDSSRNIRRAELSMFPNNTHMHLLATRTPGAVPAHPCQRQPCADVCVQTPRRFLPDDIESILEYVSKHDYSSNSHQSATGESELKYKCLCPPGLLNVDDQCVDLAICSEDQAFCHHSNVCIMKSQRCDGTKDCKHGEDEEGCPAAPSKCKPNEKLCDDMCIDKNVACVITTIKTPGVTSTTTESVPLCSSLQFPCGAGYCIESSQRCDGVPDCPDFSDESPTLCATLSCLHTEFMCPSGNCIYESFRCDGDDDCRDGADEMNCETKTCPLGEFQCRDLECIDITKRCDAQQDCADFSDEDNCEYPFPEGWFDSDKPKEPEPDNCAEWEHTCELNRTICLPLTARCNGHPDCPGHTDEAGCWDSCSAMGVHCRTENRCVPIAKVCDGEADCAGGEDETPEFCSRVNKTSQLYPIMVYPKEECRDGYWCQSGQCVEWHSVCDSHYDCVNGTDEGGLCSSACVHHNCSFACQASPEGAVCRCAGGRALAPDRVSCVDIDECALGLCSHHCHNTDGSFACSCHPGYALRPDRRSCKALTGNVSLLYVAGNTVRSMTLDGRFAVDYSGSVALTDIDYDVRRRKLYVTAENMLIEVNGTRDRVNVTNVGQPTVVAVDWVTGNVYFADTTPTAPRLRVCHLDRRRCATLHKLPAHSHVTALVIDPSSRKLFYLTQRDLECVVWATGLAGRRPTQLAVAGCSALGADTFAKRLYVADAAKARLYTMRYDGSFDAEVLTDKEHLQSPHDLTLFEDHIYFLDKSSSKLGRCLLFGKKRCEMYFERVFDATSFVINHESAQRGDVPDFCEDFKCDNVCVLGDLDAICVCDDGSVAKDGSCPLPGTEMELPLFNGWTYRDYTAPSASPAFAAVGSVLAVCACTLLLYYLYRQHRKRQSANYVQVRFQNAMAGDTTPEGSTGLISPISTPPSVQMTPMDGRRRHEFFNPMELFRNWRPSFRRDVRPIGTAGLEINLPPASTSDAFDQVSETESDLDVREHKRILNLN